MHSYRRKALSEEPAIIEVKVDPRSLSSIAVHDMDTRRRVDPIDRMASVLVVV
jgi:hypothetical protein